MSNETVDIFWKQLQTNTPFQITFLGALLSLVAIVVSAFMRSESIIVLLVLLAFQIGILLYQLYTIYCVQNGNCTILAYVMSIMVLLMGVVGMFLVIAQGDAYKGAFVSVKKASSAPVVIAMSKVMKTMKSMKMKRSKK